MADDSAPPARAPRETRLLDPDTGEPYVGKGGRPYGATDIINSDIRKMLTTSLQMLGGADYFAALGVSEVPSDRSAYTSLIGRCIPTEIKGELQGNYVLEIVNYAALQQREADEARTIDMPAQHPLLD
jgi:hypothetical protein